MGTKIDRNFQVGQTSAEHDKTWLAESFLETHDYDTIQDPEDRRTFIIGRTGSGKSACFQQLESVKPDKVIRINPDLFALQYIDNIQILEQLRATVGSRLESFFIPLWKHVLIVSIIRHKFPHKTPNTLAEIIEFFRRRNSFDAVEYVEKYGDSFWETDDVLIKTAVSRVTNEAEAEISAHFPKGILDVSGKKGKNEELIVSQETRRKFQGIINQGVISKISNVIQSVDRHILGNKKDFLYIIIDDLDKDWIDSSLRHLLTRCLLDVVMDLTQRISNLKILVALRTNLFMQLDLGLSTTQEEKYTGQTLHLRWEERDITAMLERRLDIASIRYKITPPWTISSLFTAQSSMNYILEHTLLRPRDAIFYVNECLTQASGNQAIKHQDVLNAELSYSRGRLSALRDEWKDPYQEIDKVLLKFKGQTYKMSRTSITGVFHDIALLLMNDDFIGKDWLEPLCTSSQNTTIIQDDLPLLKMEEWYRYYGKLFLLLFNIGFLGFSKKSDKSKEQVIYSYQQEERAQKALDGIESIMHFYIHPAFYQSLAVKFSES